jgi:hypothetical protein
VTWPGNACAATATTRRTSRATPGRRRTGQGSRTRSPTIGGCAFAARPSRSAAAQAVIWTPQADPAVILLTTLPDWLATAAVTLDPRHHRAAPEGGYARDTGEAPGIPLLFLAGTSDGAPLAALVPIGAGDLDRAEEVLRFLRARHGLAAPDSRLTSYRRDRIPRELRAADARAQGATYLEIAAALRGAERVAREPDWRSSTLRSEAIDLVEGGEALIAGGYRKLLRHRRRS